MLYLGIGAYYYLICHKRKYSLIKSISIYFIASIIYIFFIFMSNPYFTTKPWLMFTGIVFLGCNLYLFKETIGKKILIYFTVWTHILVISYICDYIAVLYRLPNMDIYCNQFIIKIIVFPVTSLVYSYFLKNSFSKLIEILTEAQSKVLLIYPIMSTLVVISYEIAYYRVEPQIAMLSFFTIISLCFVLVYMLIYKLVKVDLATKALKKEILTDDLTGIGNRKKLFLDINKLILEKRKFAIAYIDLNNFKSINDQYGHERGDQYLLEFIKNTKAWLNKEDKLYRLSGDEFIVICKSKNVNYIVKNLKRKELYNFYGRAEYLGASVGVSYYPMNGTNIEELLSHGDRNMYIDKEVIAR